MKILLIDPPMQSIMLARADWYPMSLSYLAGSAVAEGHDVLIYNGEHDKDLDYVNLTTYSNNYHLYPEALNNVDHYAWKKYKKVLSQYKPDIIGITAFSVKFPSALRIAAISKDYNPTVPVIMGGQHTTIMTDQVLNDKNIDFAVRGEGEQTFIEFIHQFESNKSWPSIDGLCYKQNKRIIKNKNRELIENIDNIAYPSKETLYDIENYSETSLSKLFASRGCPYQCTYCGTQNIWTNKVRFHSPERIVNEIKQTKKDFGSTYFTFFDDVFGLHKKNTYQLLDKMIESNLDINWDCLTRANLVSDELLIKMKKAGCKKIDMGVESGSDKILLDTKKGVNKKQILKGANLVKKHKIMLYMFFMIGLPTETEADVEETKIFLKLLKPDWAGISIFTPIPGTEIYNELREKNFIEEKPDFAKFSHQSPNSNFAYNMGIREDFPALAKETIEFIQNYNGSMGNLIRRGMSRGYLRNPKLFLFDLVKLLTWKGILTRSHHTSHTKFYAKTAAYNR